VFVVAQLSWSHWNPAKPTVSTTMYADDSATPIVLLPRDDEDEILARARNAENFDLDGSGMKQLFKLFFRNFTVNNGRNFIYREALRRQWDRGEYFIDVDLQHVIEFCERLHHCLLVRVRVLQCTLGYDVFTGLPMLVCL
jgi:hypothetical protein